MTSKRSKALPCDGGPNFERIVVGSGHDTIAAKLKARDDMIVMTLQHLRRSDWSRAPIHFDDVLAHVGRFPGR